MTQPIFETAKQQDDGELYRCVVELADLEEMTNKFEDGMKGLPGGWTLLEWYALKDVPCYSGDTSYIAVHHRRNRGYFTHDGWCTTCYFTGDIVAWARLMCQVTFGDVAVEELSVIEEEDDK